MGTVERIEKYDQETTDYKKRTATLEPLIEKMAARVDELSSDRNILTDRIQYLEAENIKLGKELHAMHAISARNLKSSNAYKESKNETARLLRHEKDLGE